MWHTDLIFQLLFYLESIPKGSGSNINMRRLNSVNLFFLLVHNEVGVCALWSATYAFSI